MVAKSVYVQYLQPSPCVRSKCGNDVYDTYPYKDVGCHTLLLILLCLLCYKQNSLQFLHSLTSFNHLHQTFVSIIDSSLHNLRHVIGGDILYDFPCKPCLGGVRAPPFGCNFCLSDGSLKYRIVDGFVFLHSFGWAQFHCLNFCRVRTNTVFHNVKRWSAEFSIFVSRFPCDTVIMMRNGECLASEGEWWQRAIANIGWRKCIADQCRYL